MTQRDEDCATLLKMSKSLPKPSRKEIRPPISGALYNSVMATGGKGSFNKSLSKMVDFDTDAAIERCNLRNENFRLENELSKEKFLKWLAVFVLLAVFIIGLFSPSASAADYKVIIPVSSKHIDAERVFNEENYGLGLQVNSFGLLAYRNSYKDTSVMAYYDFGKTLESGTKIGVSVGAVTGYDYADVIPIAQPYIEYSGFNISLIPTGLVDYTAAKAIVVFSYRIDL